MSQNPNTNPQLEAGTIIIKNIGLFDGLLKHVKQVLSKDPEHVRPFHWKEKCDSTIEYSSKLQFHPAYSKLCSEILKQTKTLGFEKLEIQSMFANRYHGGDSQEFHCHAPSIISGVYYPLVDAGASCIRFKTGSTTVTPENGMLLLFSGEEQHRVEPHTKGERYSIAFNLHKIPWA